MFMISHIREIPQVTGIPPEIVSFAENIVRILDAEYGGGTRDPLNDDGGYVVILAPQDEISVLHDIGLEAEKLCPECTDIIKTSTGVDYVHAMMLFNNDFSCHIICEKTKAPANLLD